MTVIRDWAPWLVASVAVSVTLLFMGVRDWVAFAAAGAMVAVVRDRWNHA